MRWGKDGLITGYSAGDSDDGHPRLIYQDIMRE